MICNRCGTEYTGDRCPICFHQITQTPEIKPTPGLGETQAPETTQSPQPASSSGVHSDTVRDPFPPIQDSCPPPNNSWNQSSNNQWNQPAGNQFASTGWNTVNSNTPPSESQTTQQHTFRFCPRCGSELHGKFCSECGYHIEPVAPQASPASQVYVNGRPVPSHPSYTPYANSSGSFYQSNPNAVHAFTERYQEAIRSGDPKYQKKLSPWVKALIVVMIIFELMGVVTYAAFYLNGEDYLNEFLSEYGFSDDYYNQGDPSGNYLDLDPDYDYKSSAKDENAIPDHITDTGESILPNGVSIEEYRQLSIGMDYATVSSIIGGDALSTETIESENKIIAMWPGEYEINAVVTITFENGAVTSIEQRGLY